VRRPGRLRVCATLLCAAALAQTPPVVIRTETRLVLVDAVVRDKKGKTVSDLGAGDFRLWEDGKARPITSFSLEEAGSPDQPETEYLLFLFDSLGVVPMARLAAEKSARAEVASFAGAYAGPSRYMAVANFNGDLWIVQNFTAMAERVRRAAADTARVADVSLGGPWQDTSLDQDPRTALAQARAGYSAPQAQPARPNPVVDAIATLADSMAAIRGRKSLVVVSAAQPTIATAPPDWQIAAAARACNRANVAVYATHVALKELAEATGGRSIASDLVRELGGIVDDREKSYALGFQPVESPDGSCHSLRVQVTRSGLQVRARNGYCNSKAPDLLAGKVEGKALEARASGPSAGNAAASVELPYFHNAPGIALVDLAMEMDVASLKFARQNGKQHAELGLVGLAYGPDGEVAGRFSDNLPLDFDTAEQAEAFRKQPYRYERQFRLPSGRYNVRVAFGSGDQSFGKAEAPLTVEAWDGKRLAMSGIALAGESRKAPELTSDLDPSLLEGHKDLVAQSSEISPSGGNRFHRSGPCLAYLEVYDAMLAGPNPPTFGLAVRVFDKRTGEQKAAKAVNAAAFIKPGSAVVAVLLDVPIASLSAGSYAVEIKAVRSPGGDSVVRTADFQVVE